jgi:quinoprotein glucose dehydrogenase
MDDIARITPEHEQACREILTKHDGGHNRGAFTPATADGALVFPTTGGGASWGGVTFDADFGYYIINTTDSGGFRVIRPLDSDPGASDESPRLFGRETGGSNNASIHGWPCWQPPWGRLIAIDVNTGNIACQGPFGSVEQTPARMKTGGPSPRGGPIFTAGGLAFIGASTDRLFHAFSAKTGEELSSTRLEEIAQSIPVTWLGRDGNQYVAIAAGSKLLAFKLPASEGR